MRAKAPISGISLLKESPKSMCINTSCSYIPGMFPTAAPAALFLVLLLASPACRAQQQGQTTFSSPEQASQALYNAAKNNDERALVAVFGPEGKNIISSGDHQEDVDARANFAKRYDEMHRLVKEPNGTITLYIGPWNWPYPIPLVEKQTRWYFNTQAGKQEILFRRVGRNEMSAIHVLDALVAAQKEYYAQHHQEYARKVISDSGQQDGLYWPASDPSHPALIGPLLANAVTNQAAIKAGTAVPFHGYFFEMLTKQGQKAPGGAQDYVVDNKMTGGFAFVAYPAAYRSSGVMTFLVAADGTVYEKDLGKKTESACQAMKEFNPAGWQKVEPEQSQSDPTTSATK